MISASSFGCELAKFLKMRGAVQIYTHGAGVNVIWASAAPRAVPVYTNCELDTLF